MYHYQVEFVFVNGEISCIDIFNQEKVENPTPFNLLDLKELEIDWPNVVMMKVNVL